MNKILINGCQVGYLEHDGNEPTATLNRWERVARAGGFPSVAVIVTSPHLSAVVVDVSRRSDAVDLLRRVRHLMLEHKRRNKLRWAHIRSESNSKTNITITPLPAHSARQLAGRIARITGATFPLVKEVE